VALIRTLLLERCMRAVVAVCLAGWLLERTYNFVALWCVVRVVMDAMYVRVDRAAFGDSSMLLTILRGRLT